MKLAELDGKRGYYDEATDSFFPESTLKPAELEGKRGLYHPETDTFFAADIPAPKEEPGLLQRAKDFFARQMEAPAPGTPAPETSAMIDTDTGQDLTMPPGSAIPDYGDEVRAFGKDAKQFGTEIARKYGTGINELAKGLVRAIEAPIPAGEEAMPHQQKAHEFFQGIIKKLEENQATKEAAYQKEIQANGAPGTATNVVSGVIAGFLEGIPDFLIRNPIERGLEEAGRAKEQGQSEWGQLKAFGEGATKRWIEGKIFHYLGMMKRPAALAGNTAFFGGRQYWDTENNRKAFEADLQKQGLNPGTPEYESAMDSFNTQAKEGFLEAIGTALAGTAMSNGKGIRETLAQSKAAEILARARQRAGVPETGQPGMETAPGMPPTAPTPAVQGTVEAGAGEGLPERRMSENQGLRRVIQEYEDRAISTGDRGAIEEVRAAGVWKDPITTLLNKRGYEALKTVREQQPEHFWLDLDNFKATNDKMTHEGGDKVIEAVGDVLAGHLGEYSHLAARWGGDEFAGAGAGLGPRLEAARETLANLQVPYEIPAGAEYPKNSGNILDKPLRVVQNGVKLSFGVGKSQQEAYNGNEANKRERAGQGLRYERKEGPADFGRTGAELAARNALPPDQVATGNRGPQGQPQEVTSPTEVTPEQRKEFLYAYPFLIPHKIVGSVGFALRKLGNTQIMDGIKRAFTPTLREGGEKVAAIMSEEVSRMERARDQFMHGMKEADKLFGKSSADANLDFMQRMDTGAKQQTPELQAVSDAVDAMFKEKVKAIQDLGTGKLEQARENYFPHIWKRGDVDAVRKAAFAALSRRPMEGSRAFLKHRVFDDVMAGIEAGYKPVSNNPLDLVALKMMEMDKYLITHHTMNALKEEGLVKFVKLGQKAPDGFIKIDDRYGTVFAPKAEEGGAGPQLVGHYYAADPIGQVVNNYTSQNLYNNKYVGSLFSAYMSVANHLNQFQLGVFSAFHGGFTSMESVISQGALGLRQLSEGRMSDAAKSFVKTPFAWITNPARGNKLIKEWNTPGSQGAEMGQIIEGLMASGGRLHTLRGERFQTNDTKKLIEAWNRGTVGGKLEAVARSPLALVEQSARPILEWLVPRQKFGVFAEMAGDWLKNNPNASHEEMRGAMRQFWNRVDSRLGQVVYDRIFAHNVAKNVVQALVRAPGWTGGTILEVGGGVKDAAKFISDLSEGKKPAMTDRMAYTISLLAVTAAANGMLTYLFTGEKPKDKDFWAFRTGRKDEHGKDERFMLPTYAKDIWAYSQAPLTTIGHKTHPALSVGIDVAKNRDYYGNQIRDEDANFITQLAQTGKYAVKQFEPFWTRGARKSSEQGKSIGAIAAPLVGVMPAPRSLTETEAEKKVGEISRSKGPVGGYSPEQSARRDLKRDLTQDYRQGDIKTLSGVIRAAREKGVELSDQEVENIHEAKRPGNEREKFQRQVRSFSADEIMKVWQVMTDEEKKKYRHVAMDKVNNSETLTHRQKFDYRKTLKEE